MSTLKTRRELLQELFPDLPRYRTEQIEAALFQNNLKSFEDITTLPKDMRKIVAESLPWISIEGERILESARHDTAKAILKAEDGMRFESVLMANARDQWTICVSSQIGCAMGCTFCATGAMGFKRNLNADEIADQYRFWKSYLRAHPKLPQRISNIVFMGMGEPLGNYENVKDAIHRWLKCTDIGPTRITVSTVGVLMNMERLLTDPDWPPVRIAVSLHSADQKRREEIVPTTIPDFLVKLADWSHRYANTLGNRRHHITYEYTLLSGVNDTQELAAELARYIKKTSFAKVNVIPWNPVKGKTFTRSAEERIEKFKAVLRAHGIDVTQRKTMGDDIAAACGQLITETAAENGAKRIPLV
ncbi:MAG TPA: 23S rRNA (adenine(2503)-C(2))-methyltransferase RlmN [Candidatus Peribacterales bacterium]|nr:23S rRNA (adenine(2503)-C(2))-methyltransferase RlmN [Candidatus Peribacterales bacterium]